MGAFASVVWGQGTRRTSFGYVFDPQTARVATARAERVSIVVSERASPAEHTAAAELAEHLGHTYPSVRFSVVPVAPKSGHVVLLGTPDSSSEIGGYVPKARLAAPESFVVTHVQRFGTTAGVIAGADPRGVLYGVYGLLEKLGWGFYLSYEAPPQPIRHPFGFAGWYAADAPLFKDRLVFNWHNFLSSASAWELEDWRRWIRGAASMRYNTVMVHAYGNNPMFSFQHNGQVSP
jgi:hypothetical protein